MNELPDYPASDFDQGRLLLQQLGSFWTNVFQDSDILQAHFRSSGHEHGQFYLNFLETVACLSRYTVPVFHTQNWYLMTARISEARKLAALYRDDDLVYGAQTGTVEGRPAGGVQLYGAPDTKLSLVPMPVELTDAKFTLQNLVVYPSKAWVNGVDYHVDQDRHALAFRTDPFTDPLVSKRDVLDDAGNIVDTEIAIWVYKGEFDLNYVYIHFGYVLGLKMKSSEGYKQLLNACWNMYVDGFSVKHLSSFLSAISGTPTAIGPSETVQFIRTETDRQLVITDSQVYSLPLLATVTVAVGDVLTAGQTICDAVTVEEFSRSDPNYSILPAIALSKSFLSGGYFGELTFKNHDVALEYLGPDEDGKAVVRFETGGFPADVETFWDFVHNAGKAEGKTLANLLDTRTAPTNEPTALNLPSIVNPMQFMLDNLMRNNLFAIKVRQSAFNPGATGVSSFRFLRQVIPPHTTYVVFVELTPALDSIDLSTAGDEDAAGAEDSAAGFYGNRATTDVAYETDEAPANTAHYGDVHVSARQVSLTCQ